MVRQGMGIVLEHNFMMSEAGRINFKRQLSQLVGSIQLTNDLDVHTALILAPSYQKEIREKYIEQEKTCSQACRDFIDLFGFVQKNQNAMDILIEEAKTQLRLWGAPMPSFLMCNSKLTFQLTMTPDVTNFVTHGAEGQKRLKAGPDLPSYRGISIMHTRAFSMEPGAPPRDILRRRVRVAEYYRIKPHPENHRRQFQLYNEERDTWFSLSFKELLRYAQVPAPDNDESISRDYPSSRNHEFIQDFSNRLSNPCDPCGGSGGVGGGMRLGVPLNVPTLDKGYEYLKHVYTLMFNKQLKPEYTWRPNRIYDKYVYVPGTYSNAVEDTHNVDLTLDNRWRSLSKPLRDALLDVQTENLTWYRANHPNRNVFTLMTQAVEQYPRYDENIVDGYFFNTGAAVAPYRAFNPAIFPVKYRQNLYAANGRADGDRCDYSQTITSYVITDTADFNFGGPVPYDWNCFARALQFRNYNRYAVPDSLLNKQKYIAGNTYANALVLNVDRNINNMTDQVATNCHFRDIGAFYCPNHFKYIQPKKGQESWGNILGQNIIVNLQLIFHLTKMKDTSGVAHTPSTDGRPTIVNVNNVEWSDTQWENTFLFDVLRKPRDYADFLRSLKKIMEETLKSLFDIQKTDGEVNRAKITVEFLTKFIILINGHTGREKLHYKPGVVAKYQHYWYYPYSANTDEDFLTFESPGLFTRNLPNTLTQEKTNFRNDPNTVTQMTDKALLLATSIQNNLDLPMAFLNEFSNHKFMTALLYRSNRTSNFMTSSVEIPDPRNVTEREVMDFLHNIAYRLWCDQEFQAPDIWPNNPLDYLVPTLEDKVPMLPLPDKSLPPTGPYDPPGGSPGGPTGPGGAPLGIENVEIVIIRPNIEHHMLGIILGHGGESLGHTFWGQTELSCFDDSVHGIWGMSYKYHSRAVVINQKNLVRLWDIAYDGYVGGKSDTYVNWMENDEVRRFSEATQDVSKHYRGQSMMVMAFDHRERKSMNSGVRSMYDSQLLSNWPSPIVFHDDDTRATHGLAMDNDGMYVFDTREFRVFNKEIYRNGYAAYKNLMPDFTSLHKIRKNAALAAVENEVSSDSLAFQGTMRILDSTGHVIEEILGSGHHGPDFIGAASLRAGKGYKFNAPQPILNRLV